MGRILALAAKDLKLLFRDKAGFFFTFFLPLLYCMFFGAIFAKQGDGSRGAMGVTIVDEDQTDASRRFIETLQEAPEIKVDFADRSKAKTLVRKGKRVAYVVLPKGFGEQLDTPFFGGTPKLETGIDPSRQAEAGMLTGILTQYTYQAMQASMMDRDKMRRSLAKSMSELKQADGMNPVTRGALMLFLPALDGFLATMPDDQAGFGGFGGMEITQADVIKEAAKGRPRSAYDISFPQGTVWGLLGCAAGFAMSFVEERTRGTLVRLRTAPISRGEILAGKALACFATTVSLQVALFTFGRVVFGVRPQSIAFLGLAIVCSSIAFVGIMMFVSVLGRSERSAGGIAWAVMLVMAMTGGGMIPLFIMPNWLLVISHFSPVKWAILSMEGAVFRDFSLGEMMVPCGVLLAVGVVFFSVGVRAFRWVQE